MIDWVDLLKQEKITKIEYEVATKAGSEANDQLAAWFAIQAMLKGNSVFSRKEKNEIGTFSKQSNLVGESNSGKPILMLNDDLAQIERCFVQENELAEWIKKSAKSNQTKVFTEDEIIELVNLFDSQDLGNPQFQAILNTLNNQVILLTGGPGTGKTFTIVRILTGLFQFGGVQKGKVVLAAPTGKAASRMAESIRNSINDLNISDELKSNFPTEGQTIHRLLQITDNTLSAKFNKNNPLPYDVVIIDEASMMDLNLIHALVSALGEHTKLILAGDPDQLPSVEVGKVLSDFCEISSKTPYINNTKLTESRRFTKESEIGQLAHFVNNNEADKAVELLKNGNQIRFIHANEPRKYHLFLKEELASQLKELEEARNPEEAFKAFKKKKILTALRVGLTGSEGINKHFMSFPNQLKRSLKNGFPVMVTKNDYNLRVFNSDVGIYLNQDGKNRIYFESGAQDYRALNPSVLNSIEAAFAMTVHKSQGSEFDDVVLVLPEIELGESANLYTRELIYTAITRAKQKFTLIGSEKAFRFAIGKRLERKSHLVEKVLEKH